MCPHKVVKVDDKPIQPEVQRRTTIERCIEALVHSCLCHDAFCRERTCMKMKRVVIHTSICKRKHMGDCPICKQLIALCCYHAKLCKRTQCVVPFCNTVKIKLRQQVMLYERVDAARGLRTSLEAESNAIDVNMHAPAFGEDAPSGSGHDGQPGPSGVRGAGPSGISAGPSGAKPRANRPTAHAYGVANDVGNEVAKPEEKPDTEAVGVKGNGNAAVNGDGNAGVNGDGIVGVNGDGGAAVNADGNAGVNGDGIAGVNGDGGAAVNSDEKAAVNGDENAGATGPSAKTNERTSTEDE